MPQVIAPIDGYMVLVFVSHEHPPPHVHVRKDGSAMKILLHENCVEYHSHMGDRPTERTKRRALEIVAQNLDACWATWNEYHA